MNLGHLADASPSLNRKQLPAIAFVKKSVAVHDIIFELQSAGMLSPGKEDSYSDIKYSSNSAYQQFLVGNQYAKDTFFKETEAPSLEGERYKQLYFTEIPDYKKTSSTERIRESGTSVYERVRRLDPGSSSYVPEVDEHNYGALCEGVPQSVVDLLSSFMGKVSRVRLAALAPHFSIGPHIDYDPSYLVRYHIPLVTNSSVLFGVRNRVGLQNTEIHMAVSDRPYFLNTGRVHWTRNNSDHWRIHLIVDCLSQEDLVLDEVVVE